jgi:hypothetical protein
MNCILIKISLSLYKENNKMSGYSTSLWETPLFYVSPERQLCMDQQVSQCRPMPSGDVPSSKQLQDVSKSSKSSKSSTCEDCCSVYTVGGYKNPFPSYMTQMKGDNDFYFRQDSCAGSFLPTYCADPEYNAMDYLYGKKKK